MSVELFDKSLWPLAPVGSMVELANGFPFDSDSFGLEGTPLVRIRDLAATDFETFVPGPVPSRAMLADGDLVIGMDGDFNVKRWTRGPAALNQRLCRLRGLQHADIRFVEYALPTPLRWINDTQYSTTVKHLSSAEVLGSRIPAAPLDEQRRIADFLDDQVARIDNAVVRRRAQLAASSEEYRSWLLQSFFPRAQSGRPESAWPLVQFRRFASKLSRPVPEESEVVTAFRDGFVGPRSLRREDGFTFSELEQGYQGVAKGDFVFHGLDGFAGAFGVSVADGRCTPVYHVVDTGVVSPDYVALAFAACAESELILVHVPSTRQRAVDFRNWMTLGDFAIPVAESDVQLVVVHEAQTRKVHSDAMAALWLDSVRLLAEYKRSLIIAAVTGEFDVSTASERGIPA